MVIFSASKVIAYVVPKKTDGAADGEWAPKEAIGKQYLAQYGCLLEDFKVRPFFRLVVGCSAWLGDRHARPAHAAPFHAMPVMIEHKLMPRN